jgi:hypothetical protein
MSNEHGHNPDSANQNAQSLGVGDDVDSQAKGAGDDIDSQAIEIPMSSYELVEAKLK